jgi:hypothetical protein
MPSAIHGLNTSFRPSTDRLLFYVCKDGNSYLLRHKTRCADGSKTAALKDKIIFQLLQA